MKLETKNVSFLSFAPAMVWGIFIFGLSVWPGKDFPSFDWDDLLSLDKIVHVLFYALLVGLVLRGFKLRQNAPLSISVILLTAVGCTFYGWFLEWFQENFCRDRMYDVLDGLANTIGAFGVALIYIVFRKNLKNDFQ